MIISPPYSVPLKCCSWWLNSPITPRCLQSQRKVVGQIFSFLISPDPQP